MDLISSTLDKYLKHRFNENEHQHQQQPQIQPKSDKKIPIATTNHIITNGTSGNECKIPTIHNISIKNSQPCCVAIRADLQYLAAGFENSHIYLWKLDINDESDINVGNCSALLAHSGSVYGIQFINDNTDLMLSCSEDATVRLWCLKTKCNVTIFRGHSYPIWSLDVGSQGLLFATASMDMTARLWRLDKLTPLRIFCGHDDDVEHVKFHPNEKYLATGSSDATVRLWSVSDGKMVRLMVGHEEPIISLSFLPDGKFLASASCDGIIKLWNLATNSVTSQLNVPASYTISFSHEQKFVSSCGIDHVLSLWQVVDGTGLIEKKKFDFRTEASSLIQSQFHWDNKLFVISYVTDGSTKTQK